MANEKKMIVTDLDGTLLKNDKTISKNTIEAINELRMRGHKFVIATARPLRAAKKFLESVETDAGIYHNGALKNVYEMGTMVYKGRYRITGLNPYTNLAFLCCHFYREATDTISQNAWFLSNQ